MFRVGDLVTLLSGGPVMTVIATATIGIEVVWFNNANDCRKDWFPGSCLKPATVAV